MAKTDDTDASLVLHAGDAVTTPDGSAHEIGSALVPAPGKNETLLALTVALADAWTAHPHPHAGSWPQPFLDERDRQFIALLGSSRRQARRYAREHRPELGRAARETWADELEDRALAVLGSGLGGRVLLEPTRHGVLTHPGHGCESTSWGLRCDLLSRSRSVLHKRPPREQKP